MRVLYVEDDETMAKSVWFMLHQEGHECDITASGKEAIRLGKHLDYDVVLLDIMLPDIDGIEVMHRLRQEGVRTPILLQTGLVDRDSDLEGLGFGVAKHLIKPFNKMELVEGLQAAISRPEQFVDLAPRIDSQRREAPWETGDEHGPDRPFKMVKAGKILHNGGTDCVILNLSRGGAGLKLLDPNLELPRTFTLELRSGGVHQCEVRWRCFDKVGVKFQ